MGEKTVIFYNQVKKIWEELSKEGEARDVNLEFEINKKLLNITQVGVFYYFIFNVVKGEFEFVSENIQQILGFDSSKITTSDFLDKIHPEDKPYFFLFEEKVVKLLIDVPKDKIFNYKVQYDFRIKNSEGKYVRILHQMSTIECDENKNILRSLAIHTDITHIKESGTPKFSFIGFDGEPSFYDLQFDTNDFKTTNEIFTKREKEVLSQIIQGCSSKEIAESLFISIHTVNTHRKNILSKSGCTNPNELILKTISEGWI